MSRAVEVPGAVLSSLEALFGCSAASVQVYEHSWFVRLHGRAIATTRRNRIYLRGSAREFFDSPTLLLHEYCHVLSQWRTGTLTTWRYVLECARRGYWNNRFEIEARRFAEQNTVRFRHLMASAAADEAGAAAASDASAEQSLAMVETARDRPQ